MRLAGSNTDETMNRQIVLLWSCFALAALPLSVLGSGSYMGRLPTPPSELIDSGKYELGKNLFLGKVVPNSTGKDRASQATILRDLQGKLPKKVQAAVNLPALAGKLSPQQLDSLGYYLSVRYKVK